MYIICVLFHRPHLMKSMDASAAKAREATTMTTMAEPGNPRLVGYTSDRPGDAMMLGRDNLGYEFDPEAARAGGRQQQQPYQSQHHPYHQPQYSNDYRRVYRDEADYFLHERDKLNRKGNNQQARY